MAKNWCETIRASQVIPVYPLTEDLQVGDVFLVETTVASQAQEYQKRGFLALDDFRVRLPFTNFHNVYFNSYWKDDFGNTPHVMPEFTNSVAGTNANAWPWTSVAAPRVAFPPYSFQARSGFGLAAAFPIQGVPVALSFLKSDQVNGSVTITDARTFAGDPGDLFASLQSWASQPPVRQMLAQTVRNIAPTTIYLRVVSRVYLARAMDVYFQKAGSSGGNARAGTSGGVSMTTTNGTVDAQYANVLNTLNSQNGGLATATQAGGAVTFVSASDSTVGMSQSFDRPLAVGYLAFDVPVFPGGDLGYPVPTFQRLQGKLPETREMVGPLSLGQAQFKADQLALESVADANSGRAVRLMSGIVAALPAPEFSAVAKSLAGQAQASPPPAAMKALVKEFNLAAVNYATVSGREGARYQQYAVAFARAFSDSEKSK
jgi:hypothetical protein